MADAARYWEDVKEGDALPEVRVATLTRTDFVKYAGASATSTRSTTIRRSPRPPAIPPCSPWVCSMRAS
jgi:hypothetical protein